MDEVIEAIVNDAVERATAFSPATNHSFTVKYQTACRIYRIRR